MSIYASIYHLTHYSYDRPVTLSPQIVRLRPAPHSRTRVISHSLKVSPGGHFVNHQQDPYGNWMARFVFPEPVREFKIEVDLTADMTVYNPFDFFVEDSAERWPFEYPEDLRDDLVIYRTPEPAGPLLTEFMGKIDRFIGKEDKSRRAAGGRLRAELRALKEGRPPGQMQMTRRNWYRFRMRPGCVPDASGCVGILNCGKFPTWIARPGVGGAEGGARRGVARPGASARPASELPASCQRAASELRVPTAAPVRSEAHRPY